MLEKKNSFKAKDILKVGNKSYNYYRLNKLQEDGIGNIDRLPYSIKILLEAVLRNENGYDITTDDVKALANYNPKDLKASEIPFKPARVVLQDFTGVPAVVDLAALRSAMHRMGGDPSVINPHIPVDLVIDHSVQVDVYDDPLAMIKNSEIEFERNRERYEFLRWGQKAFDNFNVVPPASGIVHQVNLEYIAKGIQTNKDNDIYPDSLVGTDSHTTMINGLGVVGWGVGGIEAEAVMLGQPIYMLTPEVVGFKLTGKLSEGVTATDLTLRVTEMLRELGVVGKFVEFFGEGLTNMTLPDRATIANMAPEYGATMGYFPVDDETLSYLRQTGRSDEEVAAVEAYYKAQGIFRTDDSADPEFATIIELDISTVVSSVAGPKRPQDRINLTDLKKEFNKSLTAPVGPAGFGLSKSELANKASGQIEKHGKVYDFELSHGDVVLAAITSCTNTSNPSVMLAAGIVAKKAVEHGLSQKPYVKTSLAPGSKVVTEYLTEAGLLPYLEKIGFGVVGYGCTTCIGNSGPLPEPVVKAINEGEIIAASASSGNRNFEGRLNPHTKANYLMAPPLVVAYALAGTVDIDFKNEPIGQSSDGNDVYLKDIWPTSQEMSEHLKGALKPEIFKKMYDGIEESNEEWNAIPVKGGELFDWDENSTYIQEPPFFVNMSEKPSPISAINDTRVLVKVGNSITTDHISPAGAIPKDGPAARYLMEHGVEPKDFNSFGSRRGNDRVMTRGTFANIRLRNQMAPGTEGGWTKYLPTDEEMFIFDASLKYKADKTPTIVLAGNDYGMGSSRDWAAKGPQLLGIEVAIAESFERIHRSNLIGMGVLPLQFKEGENAESLGLSGKEYFSFDIDDNLKPLQDVEVKVKREDGSEFSFNTTCRIDTPVEIDYYRNGGILHTVLRQIYAKETKY